MFCADGSECWTPTCCSGGIPCLKAASRQPEPESPQPFTIDLGAGEWVEIEREEGIR